MRNKIPIKPITRYNPLVDMKATMGVAVWEADKKVDEGGEYLVGRSMKRAEFNRIKAMGQTGLPGQSEGKQGYDLDNGVFAMEHPVPEGRGLETPFDAAGKIGSHELPKLNSLRVKTQGTKPRGATFNLNERTEDGGSVQGTFRRGKQFSILRNSV